METQIRFKNVAVLQAMQVTIMALVRIQDREGVMVMILNATTQVHQGILQVPPSTVDPKEAKNRLRTAKVWVILSRRPSYKNIWKPCCRSSRRN